MRHITICQVEYCWLLVRLLLPLYCVDQRLDSALHGNDIAGLRQLAFLPGGYGSSEVRKKVWPVLIAANPSVKLLGNNGSVVKYCIVY